MRVQSRADHRSMFSQAEEETNDDCARRSKPAHATRVIARKERVEGFLVVRAGCGALAGRERWEHDANKVHA